MFAFTMQVFIVFPTALVPADVSDEGCADCVLLGCADGSDEGCADGVSLG